MTRTTTSDSLAAPGISGLGHIALTVAFVLFFLSLRSHLRAEASTSRVELVSEAV